MRNVHLAVGLVGVVAFLITGQLMRHHTPPLAAMSDAGRLMYRSRHIYILGAGLVNLALGIYYQRLDQGWRRVVQTTGSVFLIAAPVLLVLAFVFEPGRGFRQETPWSHAGLYALFAGSMALVAGGVPRH